MYEYAKIIEGINEIERIYEGATDLRPDYDELFVKLSELAYPDGNDAPWIDTKDLVETIKIRRNAYFDKKNSQIPGEKEHAIIIARGDILDSINQLKKNIE